MPVSRKSKKGCSYGRRKGKCMSKKQANSLARKIQRAFRSRKKK